MTTSIDCLNCPPAQHEVRSSRRPVAFSPTRLLSTGTFAAPVAELDFSDADTLPSFPLDVERGAELEQIPPRGFVS